MAHDARITGHITGRWNQNDGTVVNLAHALVWTPTLISDVLVNDSDKSIAVTAEREWEILSVWAELISDANGGNRHMALEFQDASNNVLMTIAVGIVQADTLTRKYLWASNLPDLVAFRDTDSLMTPMPAKVVLPAGFFVRVFDRAAIAATTDDLVVRLLVNERIVP